MGKKYEYYKKLVAQERQENSQKAVDAVKTLIGGLSKAEREQIQRELEQEADEEEEPLIFKGIRLSTASTMPKNAVYWIPSDAQLNWLAYGRRDGKTTALYNSCWGLPEQPKAEDVEDVNFED